MDSHADGRRCARANVPRNSQRYFKDSKSVVKLHAGKRSNIGEGEEEEEERRPRESDGRSLKIDSLARACVMLLRSLLSVARTDRAVLHLYLVIGIYTRVSHLDLVRQIHIKVAIQTIHV